MCMVMGIIYLVIMLTPLVLGNLYTISETGEFQFTKWQYCVNQAGCIDAILCFVATMLNRKSVTKITGWGIVVFAPIEVAVLQFEPFFHTVYFISYTYILPFVIFYILFHCTKYDAVIGCQNADAMDTQIDKAIRHKLKFVILNVNFPQLQKREFGDIRNTIDYVSSQKCREIERLHNGIRLYSSSIYSYYLFAAVHTEEEAQRIIEGTNKILLESMSYKNYSYNVYSKQTIIRENPQLLSAKYASSMIGYLRRKLSNSMENERIIASDKDYEHFATYYEVEQAVLDIKANNEIDDERVLCYIQPIYDIETGSFRTGESLMRMKIGDRMISPGQFIDVAEQNNCIHALTRVMLNKVCKRIKVLEDEGYDFDGITVNCSTLEFEDRNLHNEIYEIIEQNKIKPEHIRLEITESTSTANYDNILYNMQQLNERGIIFYLDDFGTGYSNMERIMSWPFKTIKFDKSILYKAQVDAKSDEFVKMLIQFFSGNGLSTVVEGVEDEAQLEYCKAAGFDYIQGYLFAKPIPAEEVVKYYSKSKLLQ